MFLFLLKNEFAGCKICYTLMSEPANKHMSCTNEQLTGIRFIDWSNSPYKGQCIMHWTAEEAQKQFVAEDGLAVPSVRVLRTARIGDTFYSKKTNIMHTIIGGLPNGGVVTADKQHVGPPPRTILDD
jgi:hypothetical protein